MTCISKIPGRIHSSTRPRETITITYRINRRIDNSAKVQSNILSGNAIFFGRISVQFFFV